MQIPGLEDTYSPQKMATFKERVRVPQWRPQLHLFEWSWGSNLLTYSWIPLKKEPKSPIMPRNSTRLRFRTIYSSQTFEMPY